MTNIYKDFMYKKGITRLCHFTLSKNLPFILGDFEGIESGICSTEILDFARNKNKNDRNDYNRYDGKRDCICLSVQYPNCFFLEECIIRHPNFKDWVILEISTDIIDDNSFFCPVNAATRSGQYITRGIDGLRSLFQQEIPFAAHGTRIRYMNHPDNIPTDIQAEILIKDRVPKSYIKGLIFENEVSLKNEKKRLSILGVNFQNYHLKYCPELFMKSTSSKIVEGYIPVEYNN